tara:strand:+ start:2924 stop:3361 length:438 start_codon:yes stop_codon:yes gene_type:complete
MIALAVIATPMCLSAQTVDSISDVKILIKPLTQKIDTSSKKKTTNPFAKWKSTDSVDVTLLLKLTTLINVDSLFIQVGKSKGSKSIADLKLKFDDTGNSVYQRTGHCVRIHVGQTTFKKAYFAKAHFSYIGGKSSPKTESKIKFK